MKDIKVEFISLSKDRGTIKQTVESVEITPSGLANDAHAGDWHRQVSIMAIGSKEEFEQRTNYRIKGGEFAENLIISGVSYDQVKVGDRLQIGQVVLEVSQIGKTDPGHDYDRFGVFDKFDMPKNGLFAKVITPGRIRVGDMGLLVSHE